MHYDINQSIYYETHNISSIRTNKQTTCGWLSHEIGWINKHIWENPNHRQDELRDKTYIGC